jgi:hypothetical protein
LSRFGGDAIDNRDKREKAAKVADCAGEWRSFVGLSNKGREHSATQSCREGLLRGCFVSSLLINKTFKRAETPRRFSQGQISIIQLLFLAIRRTLLELGASPNYRDSKNLTPVYLSITKKNEAKVTEALLHDHAVLGTQDTQGWNEVHQVKPISFLLTHISHVGEPISPGIEGD